MFRPAVPNASLRTSLYSFRKNSIVCDPGNVEQLCHYFCPRCYFALPSKCNICPNAACGEHLCEELIPCFSTLSVGDQLRNVFRREFNQCMLSGLIHVMIVCVVPHTYQSIKDMKATIELQDSSTISDIFDGLLYKAVMVPCDADNTLKITLVLNTDGVAVFKSTNFSVWPLLLMINELPFRERCDLH